MSKRFDHRDAEARADDATKEQTTGAPVMAGAAELREEAREAIDAGDVPEEDGPSG